MYLPPLRYLDTILAYSRLSRSFQETSYHADAIDGGGNKKKKKKKRREKENNSAASCAPLNASTS